MNKVYNFNKEIAERTWRFLWSSWHKTSAYKVRRCRNWSMFCSDVNRGWSSITLENQELVFNNSIENIKQHRFYSLRVEYCILVSPFSMCDSNLMSTSTIKNLFFPVRKTK